MNAGTIGAVAASIGVPIVMAILAKFFPPTSLDPNGPGLDELRKRFQSREMLIGLGNFAVCVPIGFALWFMFRGLSTWHASLLPSGPIVFTAMPVLWAVPALFLSIVCSDPPMSVILKRVLGDEYPLFQRYQALKYKMDPVKVSRFLVGGVGIVAGVFIFLGLNWYVVVTTNEVVINRLLSVTEERYAISSIESIRSAPQLVAPNGNIVNRREWVVKFHGGTLLSTSDLPADLDEAGKAGLIRVLAEKSHRDVEEVEVFKRGEW